MPGNKYLTYIHVMLSTNPKNEYYCYPHFIDEDSGEARLTHSKNKHRVTEAARIQAQAIAFKS